MEGREEVRWRWVEAGRSFTPGRCEESGTYGYFGVAWFSCLLCRHLRPYLDVTSGSSDLGHWSFRLLCCIVYIRCNLPPYVHYDQSRILIKTIQTVNRSQASHVALIAAGTSAFRFRPHRQWAPFPLTASRSPSSRSISDFPYPLSSDYRTDYRTD